MDYVNSNVKKLKSLKSVNELFGLMNSKYTVKSSSLFKLKDVEGFSATFETFSLKHTTYFVIFITVLREDNLSYITFNIIQKNQKLTDLISFSSKDFLVKEITSLLS